MTKDKWVHNIVIHDLENSTLTESDGHNYSSNIGIDDKKKIQDFLNNVGDYGWELVSVVPINNNVYYFFKK